MFKKNIESQHREKADRRWGMEKSGNGLSQMRGKRSDVFEEEVMVIAASTEADGYTFYIYTYYSYFVVA